MPRDAASVTDQREIDTDGGKWVLFWVVVAIATCFSVGVLAWAAPLL